MDSRVSAVLLAAGSSKRMGRLKQLLPVRGKPAVRLCAETILASGINDVAVVLGPISRDAAPALDGLAVKVVFNDLPDCEMADSVKTGLLAVDPSSSAVVVFLCDHPLVSPETIKTLIRLHAEDPGRILIPAYHGRKGHPTLFPMTAIADVAEGFSLRDVIRKDPERVRLVEFDDEGVVLDMDTMEDYKNISRRAGL